MAIKRRNFSEALETSVSLASKTGKMLESKKNWFVLASAIFEMQSKLPKDETRRKEKTRSTGGQDHQIFRSYLNDVLVGLGLEVPL